jgi:hypothetical protein
MVIGAAGRIQTSALAYAADEAFGGVGKAGLITVIVVSVIAIVAFIWIFRETGNRD